MPVSSLPRVRTNATCPKCRHVFAFDPADVNSGNPTGNRFQQPAEEASGEKIALTEGLDTRSNKKLFFLFLALVLLAVGIRLWADARYNAVPYPNLLAVSAEGIAVTCGRTVYHYSADGTLIQSYPLAADVHPSQLFWDRGTLRLCDMNGKGLMTLSSEPSQTKRLEGAATTAQFRAAREPGTGRLFVSDGAKHRILVFDDTGKFQGSFGTEGSRQGEFRFPNELVFDEEGQLLVANTKWPAIDIYSPDGQYRRTLIKPDGDRTFRYPTDFVLTPSRMLVMECDGFLEKSRIRTYDRAGNRTGEMNLGTVSVIGDLGADGERLYLTDCTGRQLLTYSLADLHRLGPFSPDFAAKSAQWDRDARLYERISRGALAVLLLLCAPVIYFYVRMKRQESREIARIDLGGVTYRKPGGGAESASGDLILAPPVNVKLQRISLVLIGVGMALQLLLVALLAGKSIPKPLALGALLLCLISMVTGLVALIRAGGVAGVRRKQTEAALKRLIREGMIDLLLGEQMERVALAQRGTSAYDLALLIFTDKRLLVYQLNWNRVTNIEQVPFEAIMQTKLPAGRPLELVQRMEVMITVNGKHQPLTYYYFKADFLRLLCQEFEQRKGKVSGLPYTRLCLTCRQPLQDTYCVTCATRLAPNRQALWLSLLFPGLGQLRNGELQKGLVFIVMAVVFLMVGYLGIKGWFFEGADLSIRDKFNLSALMVLAPICYVANIVDAYRSSIRGRKPY
jgi:hypothetical protein